ncbi:MAG TPA: diaminopimelate decarboxylase, partial [Tenacibaculum sp.]|nr:diaminopimelate decarboxylase [Tenacibaculum sp.]
MDKKELLRLSDTYGCPLYVYDTDIITNQYKKITKAFSKVKNVKINYAVKALSNINILKVFNSLKSGLDTVSIQEVKLGLLAGFKPKDIIY